ncbi:MAG: hypothetical protein ACFB14_23070 [Leptolyngbyaceae cyanobacterium]
MILVTFLLSLLAWMAIGLFLSYFTPDVYYQNVKDNLGIFTTVRRGLRVTLADEKKGSDATIIM